MNIATEMNVGRMALISADYRATKALLAEAATNRIVVDDIYEYYHYRDPDTNNIDGYNSNFTQVISAYYHTLVGGIIKVVS